jgi:S-adenosylmethionine:tRNA ribosyltransferase-isomerase
MKLSDFDFSLSSELIAQYPSKKRGESKLLVLNRKTCVMEHRMFKDVVQYFSKGDALCINKSRVIPARLFGRKAGTGGKVEVFLLRKIKDRIWEVLIKPSRKVRKCKELVFNGKVVCRIKSRDSSGKWEVEFFPDDITTEDILALGKVPLPPYIKREVEAIDRDRYQTVYARNDGSVAAPTAGLHFTKEILSKLEDKGVTIVEIILHIGFGTFRPVKVKDITEHKMEREYYKIDRKSAETLNSIKRERKPVFVVGTSTTRALESACSNGYIKAEYSSTDKFIYPPYEFKVVDHLITNFHLPKSTLIMLVSAFASKKLILKAYEEAKKNDYQFFSYGDAMLIL